MRPLLLSTSLRYFSVVAETRSLSAAATQLHVAVSAISRQITNLEEVMGCALFERHARGMELTAPGLRLAAFAKAMHVDAERVIEEVRGEATRAASVVRLGCTEGFSNGFAPSVMSSFRAKHPHVAVHLNVGAPKEVSQQLRAGDVDVVLKYCIAPEPGLAIMHQQPSPILALVSPHHPLGRVRKIDIVQLLRHDLAMPDKGTTVRRAFDLCCSSKGLQYNPVYTGNAACLLQLATQGEAVMLSGYEGAAHFIHAGLLCAVPIVEAQLQDRSLHVLTLEGRTLSANAAAFVAHLVRAVKQTSQAKPLRSAKAAKTLGPVKRMATRRAGETRISSRRLAGL